MLHVAIIDYGLCNLGSVRRAFEECGADAIVAEDARDLRDATHIVLPGVGAYKDGMSHIRQGGWDTALRDTVVKDKIPLLGICLGMQLLSDMGTEIEETKGLGLIPGVVKKLIQSARQERIPHVGWNEVHHQSGDPLFHNIQNGMDFYFVHSYHFHPSEESHILARTPYCGGFVSAIHLDNVFGVQFHPEKSSLSGFQLIRNFLNYRS